MTERVLGPTGSPRRRWTLLLPLVAALALGLFYITGAQAVHDDNFFELGPIQGADILSDGDATNGPDWAAPNGLFGAGGALVNLPAPGVAASFILDDTSLKGLTDKTTFSGAGGSNKNNDAISGAGDTWHWDGGNVPAKDDLVNAYAYAVIAPAGHPDAGDLILYGGFERLDESGDSHIDLEFFQDDVRLDEPVPCNDPGSDPTPCAFLGGRTGGDIIVSMDFVQGGGLGEVHVREWDASTSTYVLDETLLGEGCNSADTACAFNNGATIDGGPWVNLDKTGNEVTNLLPNAFTEFGVNYTELVGGTPCISSVMGKTRSSQSFTAELKDFALTNFSICSLAWEKRDGSTGSDGSHPLLGGATFSVSPNPHTGLAPALTGIADCTATPCTGEDKDSAAGKFLIIDAVTGSYTITETAAPSGYGPDTDTTRVQVISGSNLSAVVGTQGVDDDGYTSGVCTGNECDFHNYRPALKITAFGYTNSPTSGDPRSGSGTAVYTAKVKNFGAASATLASSSQLAVSATGLGTGTLTCDGNAGTGNTTRTYGGTVIAANTEVTLTALTCTYTSAADGAVISATLNVNHDSTPASGSPATVSFTVQRD